MSRQNWCPPFMRISNVRSLRWKKTTGSSRPSRHHRMYDGQFYVFWRVATPPAAPHVNPDLHSEASAPLPSSASVSDYRPRIPSCYPSYQTADCPVSGSWSQNTSRQSSPTRRPSRRPPWRKGRNVLPAACTDRRHPSAPPITANRGSSGEEAKDRRACRPSCWKPPAASAPCSRWRAARWRWGMPCWPRADCWSGDKGRRSGRSRGQRCGSRLEYTIRIRAERAFPGSLWCLERDVALPRKAPLLCEKPTGVSRLRCIRNIKKWRGCDYLGRTEIQLHDATPGPHWDSHQCGHSTESSPSRISSWSAHLAERLVARSKACLPQRMYCISFHFQRFPAGCSNVCPRSHEK